MKNLAKVLVLGRPNVGKSTLINKIIGKKELITLDMPGVTRDCLEYLTDWNGKPFFLVDSGGILLEDSENIYLQSKIESLIGSYVEQATKIIFLTDFKVGFHVIDKTIAKLLWVHKDKVKVVVNKVDNPDMLHNLSEFYALGLGEPLGVSSLHGIGIGDLLDWCTEDFDRDVHYREPDNFKVSFVGRPNVGKSSLLNAVIEDERVIVDDVAGTTRDSVEVEFKHHGKTYKIIDTAGIRKKAKNAQGVEFYSVVRTKKSIGRSDIVIVMMDANLMMAEQDKRIIQMVLDAKKNLILFINKIDLFDDEIAEFNRLEVEKAEDLKLMAERSGVDVESLLTQKNKTPKKMSKRDSRHKKGNNKESIKGSKTEGAELVVEEDYEEVFENKEYDALGFKPFVFEPDHFIQKMEELMPQLKDYPKIFGAVKTDRNIKKMFGLIPKIVQNSLIRISTPELNDFIEHVIKRNPPPTKRGKKVKVKYATQVSVAPPTFVFFMNQGDDIPPNYERFIEKQFRTFYKHFEGIPIQIIFRASAQKPR
ncbi:ribosome biogenesis GTPase Der [bacterium]|nr:ribosome biogenesis GTPase Der [bacterium]